MTAQNRRGIFPPNIERERPQGWQDAKAAKKGRFRCFWGCEKVFRSRREAGGHRCPKRRETFQDMLTMNEISHTQPLFEYVLEACDTAIQANTTSSTRSTTSASASTFGSEELNNSDFSMEDLKRALPKYKKVDRINDWLNI